MNSTATPGILNPQMEIEVTTFDGSPRTVRVPHGEATVDEVLKAAGVPQAGREIRVSGKLASLETKVHEGARVELHPLAANG